MMVKERTSGAMWWAVFAGDFVSAVLYRRFVWAVLYGRFYSGGLVWAVSGEEILYGGYVWRLRAGPGAAAPGEHVV